MAETVEQNAPEKTEKQLKKEAKRQKRREKNQKKWAKQYRLLFPTNKKGKHIVPKINFLRCIGYPIHSFVYPFKLYGFNKAPDGACIYVGNHYCLWDIFYPAHTTREGIHFMAKQSILEAPVLGWWARKIGVIGAMRDGSDVRTLMDAMKALKHGEKISIFPEGTRNKVSDEEFLPFHGGAALLAIKTKTPVIPFAICNRPHVFRRTNVIFGEPMELTEYYDRKLTSADYEEAEEKLKNRIYELREEFRAFFAKYEKKGKKK